MPATIGDVVAGTIDGSTGVAIVAGSSASAAPRGCATIGGDIIVGDTTGIADNAAGAAAGAGPMPVDIGGALVGTVEGPAGAAIVAGAGVSAVSTRGCASIGGGDTADGDTMGVSGAVTGTATNAGAVLANIGGVVAGTIDGPTGEAIVAASAVLAAAPTRGCVVICVGDTAADDAILVAAAGVATEAGTTPANIGDVVAGTIDGPTDDATVTVPSQLAASTRGRVVTCDTVVGDTAASATAPTGAGAGAGAGVGGIGGAVAATIDGSTGAAIVAGSGAFAALAGDGAAVCGRDTAAVAVAGPMSPVGGTGIAWPDEEANIAGTSLRDTATGIGATGPEPGVCDSAAGASATAGNAAIGADISGSGTP
ncbi:hypothetical protein [Sphingomonas bacterium]|uniref:hypothetical protein n=1 Tax=Sphingomonas bacterium TaxID=1895847 RepID=UPI001576506A|nr:hypothetical protein [Sphingomonas bacterium]